MIGEELITEPLKISLYLIWIFTILFLLIAGAIVKAKKYGRKTPMILTVSFYKIFIPFILIFSLIMTLTVIIPIIPYLVSIFL